MAGASAIPAANASTTGPEPSVTVATGLRSALGINSFLMTPSQKTAVGPNAIDRTQELLSQAIDLLGITDSGVYPDGFAGLVENPATGTLNVWWKGTMPPTLGQLIQKTVPEVVLVVWSAPERAAQGDRDPSRRNAGRRLGIPQAGRFGDRGHSPAGYQRRW